MIHPTAVIHPKARLDSTVVVGPYAVIDEGVTLGPQCVVGPHVYLTGSTTAGAKNRFHAGAVIGDAPQDMKYTGDPSRLTIGDNNTFREHVTVHRANKTADATIIGSNNLLMGHVHIAHDCILGNNIILANGALVAGHVVVSDRAFLSGNCCVHQFVRIGTLSMMQGGTAVTKDLPPYCVVRDVNGLCGLNTVGLRRAGIPGDQRMDLRRLYHDLFRGTRKWKEALAVAREEFTTGAALSLLEFVSIESARGLCSDPSRRGVSSATAPTADADEDAGED